jgi:hypothetical protein
MNKSKRIILVLVILVLVGSQLGVFFVAQHKPTPPPAARTWTTEMLSTTPDNWSPYVLQQFLAGVGRKGALLLGVVSGLLQPHTYV